VKEERQTGDGRSEAVYRNHQGGRIERGGKTSIKKMSGCERVVRGAADV